MTILHHKKSNYCTIQYGYSKCETHAQVFSQTFMHGNSKNEITQRNGRKQEEKSEYGKKQRVHEKISPNVLTITWNYCSPGVSMPQRSG